jgi:hypothetical protein
MEERRLEALRFEVDTELDNEGVNDDLLRDALNRAALLLPAMAFIA